MHKHDPELIECSECGSQFDLARQNYYDSKCPSCVDNERSWPSCIRCQDRFDPDEGVYAHLTGGPEPNETVLACSDECKRELEKPRW